MELKIHGEDFINRRGMKIAKKTLNILIYDCCRKKCYIFCTPEHQANIFNSFDKLGKEAQDHVLSCGLGITDKRTT